MKHFGCKIGKQIPIPEPPLVCGCVDLDKLRAVTLCAVGVIALLVAGLLGVL